MLPTASFLQPRRNSRDQKGPEEAIARNNAETSSHWSHSQGSMRDLKDKEISINTISHNQLSSIREDHSHRSKIIQEPTPPEQVQEEAENKEQEKVEKEAVFDLKGYVDTFKILENGKLEKREEASTGYRRALMISHLKVVLKKSQLRPTR